MSNSGLPAPIKTLRMILIFQLEISRLMCICWHKFFNRYTYFCVSYIIVISERIRHILFKVNILAKLYENPEMHHKVIPQKCNFIFYNLII